MSLSEDFSPLKDSKFRVYAIALLTSMIGTWMQSIAQSWLIYELTGSAKWLGIIAFCSQAPAFFSSPVAGVLADLQDKRRALIRVQYLLAAAALVLGVLTLAGKITVLEVAVISAVTGILSGFDMTLRHSIVVELVGRRELGKAISINSFIMNGSRVIGPSVAGVALAWIAPGWIFMLNGVSFLAFIYGIRQIQNHPTASTIALEKKTFEHLWDSLKYSWKHPEISQLLALTVLISFVSTPYMTLLPAFAKVVLRGNSETLGLLSGLSGVGAILGSFGISHQKTHRARRRRLLLSIFAMGFFLVFFAVSSNLILSCIGIFALGFFVIGTFPTLNNAIQQVVDDSMRGRVLSLYTMAFVGAMPLGGLMAGAAADRVGPQWVVGVTGLICIFIGSTLLFRNLRADQSFATSSSLR